MANTMRCSGRLTVGILTVALLGCGGGTGPDSHTRTISASAGDNQTARISSAVPVQPAVVIRDENNNPLAGVSVTFAVETGGGSVIGATQTTNASGIATVGNWTLGPAAGTNTLTATAAGTTNGQVRFTATARLPYWTVMVYMAADNNLSVYGILNLDSMEAAGYSPEVQLVTQAEFNQTELAQYGCTAACFNRPNFNTFRYVFTGAGTSVLGPNGPTTDIGNVDMTSPATLHQFVVFAQQIAPAQHYVLVLWNHGGGYSGLLADETSDPGNEMSLPDLRAALTGLPPIDVVDFDMCLMGGYETLVELQGLAQTAVFSEATIPGTGNPYRPILSAMQANPTAGANTTARIWADQYGAYYASPPNNKSSTTISAYDLSQFGAYDLALGTVASQLGANLGTLGPTIQALLATSQKYEFPELTDVAVFLDSLRLHVSDASLQTAIGTVLSTNSGAFRLSSHARTGTTGALGAPPLDVGRSTGLHVVLPSGVGEDQFGASGPRSLAAYQAAFPGRPWTQFLASWVATQTSFAVTDQDTNRLEVYLAWDTAAVTHQADVDLWVLEPNGNLYIPFLGTITPNGVLTGDSYQTHSYFEGYYTNRFVQNGNYRFYANLWLDQQNLSFPVQFYYRYSQGLPLTPLLPQPLPQLSLANSWINDPTPTFAEVDAFTYSDLQPVAVATFPTGPALMASARPGALNPAPVAPDSNRPTEAQLGVVRKWIAERHAKGGPWLGGRLQFRAPRGLTPLGTR